MNALRNSEPKTFRRGGSVTITITVSDAARPRDLSAAELAVRIRNEFARGQPMIPFDRATLTVQVMGPAVPDFLVPPAAELVEQYEAR